MFKWYPLKPQTMPDIKHRAIFDASKKAVFEAVTTKKGLKSWWTSDVAIDQLGADYVFGFNDHTVIFRMKTIKESPNEYAEWKCLGDWPEWEGTRLIFDISERDDGKVVLNFTHADWETDEGELPRCTTDWGHLMYYLKDYVEGHGDTPFMS